MAEPLNSYSIFPLGDSAMTLDLGSCIDEYHNIRVQAVHHWLQARRFPGILDIIVAYSSVSVFYDPAVVRASGVTGALGAASWVKELLERGWKESADDGGSGWVGTGPGADEAGVRPGIATGAVPSVGARAGHSFRIPVCYEEMYAPDLEEVARQRGLSVREVVELHCAGVYRVYMLGFLPGFPYLGTVDPRLETPRKMRPVPVVAGGVGIAGKQTGIYSLNSPGGWWIIGRTPAKLFDPEADPPVLFQPGDLVEFYPIPSEEFRRLSGRPE